MHAAWHKRTHPALAWDQKAAKLLNIDCSTVSGRLNFLHLKVRSLDLLSQGDSGLSAIRILGDK